MWDSSRIVPTAVAACGLFGWFCYPTGISWQVLFSIMHSELPLVRLIVSHHLQILCLNLIRNLLTEKWSSLLELSNRPGKWRTAALIFLTIFVVTLGLLIGFTPLQLHLGWCLNCCSVLYKEQKYCIFKSSAILS